MRVVADDVLHDHPVACTDPVEPPDLERSGRPGAPTYVVQEHQLLARGSTGEDRGRPASNR
jgi:hypothetical protein